MALDLKQLKLNVKPTSFISHEEFLKAIYSFMKSNVPKYSYQMLANDLGLSTAGNIHNIIKGRRLLTRKIADRIAAALELKGREKTHFLNMVKLKESKDPKEKEKLVETLLESKRQSGNLEISADQFELCSEWYHLAIREVISFPDVDQTAASVAKAIIPPIRPAQAEKSIALLIKLGLIKFNPRSGRLEQTDSAIKTGAEVEALLAIRFHHAMADMSKESITNTPQAERELSANTFRMSKRQLKKLKSKIWELQLDILSEEPSPEDSEQVYQLNFQLFPVSKVLKVKNKT